MALLGSFIDSRTLASMASNASASFAHGLPGAPDFVIAQPIGNATATAAQGVVAVSSDATNVSVFAQGAVVPELRVISVVAHSVIR